jgi:hypothetical protein
VALAGVRCHGEAADAGARAVSAILELPYAINREGEIAYLAALPSIDLTLTMLSK